MSQEATPRHVSRSSLWVDPFSPRQKPRIGAGSPNHPQEPAAGFKQRAKCVVHWTFAQSLDVPAGSNVGAALAAFGFYFTARKLQVGG